MSIELRTLLPKISEGNKDQEVHVAIGTADLADKVLVIKENGTLIFDPATELHCKQIRFIGNNPKIEGLNLRGALMLDNANAKISNSKIHNCDASIDYIIAANRGSTLLMQDCTVEDAPHSGIAIDYNSSGVLLNVDVRRTVGPALAAFGSSSLHMIKCRVSDSQSELVWIESDSTIGAIHCTFTGATRRAFLASLAESATIQSCSFSNCKAGAVSCIKTKAVELNKCKIESCEHTAVFSDNSNVTLSKCTFSNIAGNAVNGTKASYVVIDKCETNKTTFPAFVVCDGARGLIKRSKVQDSEMAGISVRYGAKASIEDCIISNTTDAGISISDSDEVVLSNVIITEAHRKGLEIYNESNVTARSIDIEQVDGVAIDVFTASVLDCKGISVQNADGPCVNLHHGGRFILKDGAFHTNATSFYTMHSTSPSPSYTEVTLNGVPLPDEWDAPISTPVPRCSPRVNDPSSFNATCLHCGRPADVFFNPCAHAVYCKACWDALDVKPTECPLCSFQVESIINFRDNSPELDEGTCFICMENPSDCICVPCSHHLCSECAKSWFATNSHCPFCRSPRVRPHKLVNYR